MKIVLSLLILFSLGACALDNQPYRRAETNILNPVCTPDGSVVRVEYANSIGTYEGIDTSHEYCPWHKKSVQ